MHAAVHRVIALLDTHGPMAVYEIRAALSVCHRDAHATINHAERVGIIVRRRHQRYPVIEIRRDGDSRELHEGSTR
jgi:hypothetical protein